MFEGSSFALPAEAAFFILFYRLKGRVVIFARNRFNVSVVNIFFGGMPFLSFTQKLYWKFFVAKYLLFFVKVLENTFKSFKVADTAPRTRLFKTVLYF
jgi:hypothetical protein